MKKSRNADLIALAIVALLGLPLLYMGGHALVDGEQRRHEAPIRALLGAQVFDALVRGEPLPQHYLQRPPAPAWRRSGAAFDARNDRRAPDFTLQRADGTPWRLSEHRGRVVVLNFWSVTCPPCIEEMPSLVSLARILRDRDDIELVTIAVDRTWDEVRTVVSDDTPMTVLLDPDRSVAHDSFGTRQFPETWVIDPEGIIRLRVDGAKDWSNAVALDVLESYR